MVTALAIWALPMLDGCDVKAVYALHGDHSCAGVMKLCLWAVATVLAAIVDDNTAAGTGCPVCMQLFQPDQICKQQRV